MHCNPTRVFLMRAGKRHKCHRHLRSPSWRQRHRTRRMQHREKESAQEFIKHNENQEKKTFFPATRPKLCRAFRKEVRLHRRRLSLCHPKATGVVPPPTAACTITLAHFVSCHLAAPMVCRPSPPSQIGNGCWRRDGVDNGAGLALEAAVVDAAKSHFHTFLPPAPLPLALSRRLCTGGGRGRPPPSRARPAHCRGKP